MLLDNHTKEPFNEFFTRIKNRRITIPDGSFETANIQNGITLMESYFYDKNIQGIDEETEYHILTVNDRIPIEFTLHELIIEGSGSNNKSKISNHLDPNKFRPISFIFKEATKSINDNFILLHNENLRGGGTCGCGPCPPPDSLHYFSGVKLPIRNSKCSDPGEYFFFPVILAEMDKFVYIRYRDFITTEILNNYVQYAISNKMIAFSEIIKFDAELKILYTTEAILDSPPSIS